MHGDQNSYAFKARIHDPRVGRFLSLDPKAKEYPHNSPYAFSENRVMDKVELEGKESSDIELQGSLHLGINVFNGNFTFGGSVGMRLSDNSSVLLNVNNSTSTGDVVITGIFNTGLAGQSFQALGTFNTGDSDFQLGLDKGNTFPNTRVEEEPFKARGPKPSPINPPFLNPVPFKKNRKAKNAKEKTDDKFESKKSGNKEASKKNAEDANFNSENADQKVTESMGKALDGKVLEAIKVLVSDGEEKPQYTGGTENLQKNKRKKKKSSSKSGSP